MREIGENKDDGMFTWVLLVLIIGGIFWAIWHFWNRQIIGALTWYRRMQVSLLDPVISNSYSQPVKIEYPPERVGMEPRFETVDIQWNQMKDFLFHPAGYPGLSPVRILGITSDLVTPITMWPALLVILGMICWAIFLAPNTRFRVRHNVDTLIKAQAQAWPVVSPMIDFDPSQNNSRKPGKPIPKKLPPFAEALSPAEFIAFNKIPMANAGPNRDQARLVFAKQLGPRWDGADVMPVHLRALFAAFALKGARKREESDAFLGEIATHWSLENGLELPKSVVARIDKIIADPKIGQLAEDVAWQHAYTSTALIRVLLWARERGGVLAPAQFIWMRAHDRGMWYPLNNAGRRTFHCEGAGVISHFMAERAISRPIIQPKVEGAIAALEEYWQENPRPIPPIETDDDGAPSTSRRKAA